MAPSPRTSFPWLPAAFCGEEDASEPPKVTLQKFETGFPNIIFQGLCWTSGEYRLKKLIMKFIYTYKHLYVIYVRVICCISLLIFSNLLCFQRWSSSYKIPTRSPKNTTTVTTTNDTSHPCPGRQPSPAQGCSAKVARTEEFRMMGSRLLMYCRKFLWMNVSLSEPDNKGQVSGWCLGFSVSIQCYKIKAMFGRFLYGLELVWSSAIFVFLGDP